MSRDVTIMAGAFAAMGVLHFVAPKPFEAIVPKPLPRKRELVHASGVAELAVAALLARPQTSRVGGALAVALLAAVFPANVQMTVSAMQDPRKPWWFKAGTVARLPLQVPMIRIALKATRS
ncbi:MAG: hypothetical protein JWQ91_2557 [Aeromicrobium sp.]|jgi:uncharacterized membrane protein|uniref:DoxX family protein n=1 Tax=Aeromicrobium sp. TaxID=1871063 RepID=UPI00262E056A|nr:hypothetical protein [Aeromicrobium sp.]MCW2788686.1 hypothetical protein [Aeromicrobium sp.]MCW2825640.1 hypothetical protein [Aeromicrobium sp.]